MIVFPNAKINIGLFITEKRNDGFHNLETIFYPINVAKDILEVIPSEKDEMLFYGIQVPGNPSQNLVAKTLQLLRDDYKQARKPVKIVLYKDIPMGAGLGGGSADAAFALELLSSYFELAIEERKMYEYALRLGSDCPFFIVNKPAIAKGRGEMLEEIELDLSAFTIQLICPELHISTSQAFAGMQPEPASYDLKKINEIAVTDWKECIVNDFEKTIFNLFPVLSEIKTQLYRQGAIYASLSGTGSTVYGIFPKGRHASIITSLPFKSYLQS